MSAIAGGVVGLAYRITTAGGHGANIGGGLMVLFGIPAATTLAILAATRAVSLHRAAFDARKGDL